MNVSGITKLTAGPLASILIFFFADIDPGNPAATAMAAVTAWVAIWWLTEATHLAVTSLLPFLLIPILGIADSKIVAAQYMDQTIFLFIGGFLLAFAIERWNLHERIALSILSKLGSKPATLLAGVMITTFLISMWISNTATTMMLFSAVMAVVYQTGQQEITSSQKDSIARALLIGLAYAASIGGMSTIVGTPPNMVFYKIYNDQFAGYQSMDFLHWFFIGFPTAALMLVAAYLILKFIFLKNAGNIRFDKHYFKQAVTQLGTVKYEEKIVFIVFATAALLWFTRSDIDFGGFVLPGWERIFGSHANFVTDSTVAIAMAFILFLIPSKNEPSRMLLSWEEAKKIPFGIILLFGSGFALAKGFEVSGLSSWLAEQLLFLEGSPPVLIIGGICLIVCIISEFASNVASIQLALPILVSLHKATGLEPLMLMVPATLAASLGFMLPVATAPNTIVFGSGRIRSADMRNAGSLLDFAGIILISLMSMVIGMAMWS